MERGGRAGLVSAPAGYIGLADRGGNAGLTPGVPPGEREALVLGVGLTMFLGTLSFLLPIARRIIPSIILTVLELTWTAWPETACTAERPLRVRSEDRKTNALGIVALVPALEEATEESREDDGTEGEEFAM
jgi:hypothetical protein